MKIQLFVTCPDNAQLKPEATRNLIALQNKNLIYVFERVNL